MENKIDQALDPQGLELYDELIKQYIQQNLENIGDIADVVPNELIKKLWDREITFDELVPVSGERHLVPCSREENYIHYIKIFYLDEINRNALTFTNVGENDVELNFNDWNDNGYKLYIVDDDLTKWNYKEESITIEPGNEVKIVGINHQGFNNCTFTTTNGIGSDDRVNISGNIMSLIDCYGETKVIPCDRCFNTFFYGFPVVDASQLILPATELKRACYSGMFSGCTNLTVAPQLPATTLVNGCYTNMFRNCISLETAPELPATDLVPVCYTAMFQGCKKLKYIKCLAINRLIYCARWTQGVNSEGIFVKHIDAEWRTGQNGIPEGWTVIDAEIN